MKITSTLLVLFSIVVLAAFKPAVDKLVSNKTKIEFFSHTLVEDIQASNYQANSKIDLQTGEVIFSLPMQGFEFEKALMQRHYNSPKFLDTKKFPKSKLVAVITNMSSIDFSKDGTYAVLIKGNLTIKDKTKAISEKGRITVKGNAITATAIFDVVLADYGIAFEKGKPSTNVAKSVQVTVYAEYSKHQ